MVCSFYCYPPLLPTSKPVLVSTWLIFYPLVLSASNASPVVPGGFPLAGIFPSPGWCSLLSCSFPSSPVVLSSARLIIFFLFLAANHDCPLYRCYTYHNLPFSTRKFDIFLRGCLSLVPFFTTRYYFSYICYLYFRAWTGSGFCAGWSLLCFIERSQKRRSAIWLKA